MTTNDLREALFIDGYVVVKNAISPAKAEYYRDQQLTWLEESGLGFKRKDKKTWIAKNLPPNFKEGIYGAVAHERFMWEIRLEQGIIDAFADIWSTSKLLVSFDGMNVTMPGVHIPAWPHTDQHASDMEFECVQGMLNTGPCGENDGGLIVMKGSAALWQDFWNDKSSDLDDGKATDNNNRKKKDNGVITKMNSKSKNGISKIEMVASPAETKTKPKDLNNFSETEISWFTKQDCTFEKLILNPGDLVLWDSRTVHFNSAPKGDSHNIRSAVYVCYGPAGHPDVDMAKKTGLFYGFHSTTHWPHVNIVQTSFSTSTGTVQQRPRKAHEWTHQVLQLAGVEPYDEQ